MRQKRLLHISLSFASLELTPGLPDSHRWVLYSHGIHWWAELFLHFSYKMLTPAFSTHLSSFCLHIDILINMCKSILSFPIVSTYQIILSVTAHPVPTSFAVHRWAMVAVPRLLLPSQCNTSAKKYVDRWTYFFAGLVSSLDLFLR